MSIAPNSRAIWLGAFTGIAPGLLLVVFSQGKSLALARQSMVLFFISVSVWPVMAVILACIRPTRRFGLGMLLGVGLGWLVMLTLCGGAGVRR